MPPDPDKKIVQEFLSAIFPADAYDPPQMICLWSPKKTTTKKNFFKTTDLASAAKFAVAQARKLNVYFGCSSLKAIPKKGRGKLEDMGAASIFWADIDILNPVHKKENLPENFDEAMAVLNDLRLAPSILIDSGHGLQAYWLLKEPYLFETPKDADSFHDLAVRLHETIAYCANRYGFTVDAVHDLTRVMRLPGTVNHKDAENPVRVRLISKTLSGLVQYSTADIDDIVIPEALRLDNRKRKTSRFVSEIKIDPVIPKMEKEPPKIVGVMIENTPKFKRTWNKGRIDLQDQSPSSYDMAIANALVSVNANDQDIADAIYHFRLKHGHDINKAKRRDYIMLTIRKARVAHQSDQSVANVIGMDGSEIEQGTKTPDEYKAEVISRINEALGIAICEVLKHGKEDSIYSFLLGGGENVSIGPIAKLLNQDHVRGCLADATRVVIRMVKKPQWLKIVEAWLSISDLIDNKESQRDQRIGSYLAAYLDLYAPATSDEELFLYFSRRLPYVIDGKIHISTTHFLPFIRIHFETKIEVRELHDLFRVGRFVNQTKSMRDPKKDRKVISRSVWIAPIEVLEGEAPKQAQGAVS